MEDETLVRQYMRTFIGLGVLAAALGFAHFPVLAAGGTTATARASWCAISVRDAEATARWYQEKLHFTLKKRMVLPEHHLRILFLELNDFTLEIIQFDDSVPFAEVQKRFPGLKDRDKLQGFLKLGFIVEDVDALAAELKRGGVKLRMEPTVDRDFNDKFILVEDNAGNTLQFFQPLAK